MQCALAARSPCWLGRADQPSLLPLHAERCPEPRAQVARRKPSLDDQRGACHRARIIAPQPCIRSVQRVPDHDAVMRIGGEAPGRRAHSRKRCQHHGLLRVAATSDRHRRPAMSCSPGSESLAGGFGRAGAIGHPRRSRGRLAVGQQGRAGEGLATFGGDNSARFAPSPRMVSVPTRKQIRRISR